MNIRRVKRLGLATVMAIASGALAGPAVSGPANSDSKLRFATASANNQNPHSTKQFAPDDVVLSNVKRGMTSVKWEADTPAGHLACQADDMLHHFDCFPSKSDPAGGARKDGAPPPAR